MDELKLRTIKKATPLNDYRAILLAVIRCAVHEMHERCFALGAQG